MRAQLTVLATLLATPGLWTDPAHAQTTPQPRLYEMGQESSLEIGCQDPCACPVFMRGPVKGTFVLTPTGCDPLFCHFAVSDVRWTVGPEPEIRVTGSGSYRIGGEVAIQHHLVLDLDVGGDARHFDSGLVPGGGEFPAIDIAVAVNGFFCWDSVFHVRARPTTASVDVGGDFLMRMKRVTPNPFRDGANVEFTIERAGPVDLTILDLQGREVRVLAKNLWLQPGPHARAWDGRSGEGREAPAGLYFARLRASGREDVRAVVKLR